MTLFGFTFLDDIDLPEFPFPDLGPLGDADDSRPNELGPRRRPTASDAAGAHRRRPVERRHH